MKIHSAYRCAVTKHQCCAAVFKVTACLVLLCSCAKPADSSLVPLHLYLCIQDPPLHTAAVLQALCHHLQTPVQSPNTSALHLLVFCLPLLLCCCAKPADSSFVPLHLHLWRSTLHTDLQSPNTSALLHLLGLIACLVLLCCCAKPADSSFVPLHLHLWRSTLHTDLQSPNTSALLQLPSSLGLILVLRPFLLCCCAKPADSSLVLLDCLTYGDPLCHTAALCHCIYTNEDPLCIQVAVTKHQCSCSV